MRSRRAVVLWFAAVAYAVAIFIASSLPAPTPEPGTVPVGDKALHALEYGVFTLLLAAATSTVRNPRVNSRAALIAFTVAALYGLTDELHQTFVPSRVGDSLDFVWDVVGAAVAAAAFHVWRSRVSRVAPVSETSPR